VPSPTWVVNWTKGIDQKTGKPLDYDPSKDIQTYAGVRNLTPGAPLIQNVAAGTHPLRSSCPQVYRAGGIY
jgi:hypothetical protein